MQFTGLTPSSDALTPKLSCFECLLPGPSIVFVSMCIPMGGRLSPFSKYQQNWVIFHVQLGEFP